MKTINVKNIILLIFLLPAVLLSCKQEKNTETPYVVMLSMDGFRWDYTDKVATPNFDKMSRLGVKANSLKPSFPTKTFPNHYSMVTGLYPDHHGIVMNSFYDETLDRYYEIADRVAVEDGVFYGGEPIWVTAEKQGVKSGSFFWVGSESEIAGVRPTYWKRYDEDFPYKQRVDSVIAWLQKPEGERPHLILWYFDEPDHTGHEAGPDSDALQAKITELDFMLGYFLIELEKLAVAEDVNVIVTSDHGMGPVDNSRKVVLNEHMNMNWVAQLQGVNPNFLIKAREGCVDSIRDALADVEGITVWKSGAVPDRLHYGTHPRTLDLVVVADSSWSVVDDQEFVVGKGAHGYDNENSDMHAIFFAYGPAFKENYTVPTFNNVDIYPLICKILNLKPAPVDGDLEHVNDMLR